VSASGRFAVVTIDDDVQAGHNEGFTAAASDEVPIDRFEEVKSLTGPPQGMLW
jgi:hypothetical protein